MRPLVIGFALLLVLPSVAQRPAPFFSLSSDRSFAPGEKPRVTFSAQNVSALDFRVYRVNDPVEFFRNLPGAHGFGGQAPPTPPARTLLERIHRWKERTRYAMRRSLREQFGDEERTSLSAFFGRESRVPIKGAGGDRYAEVPLLNPQQLVKTWRVLVNQKNPWDTQRVDVEVPGNGLYIVEATAEGLRAATIVSVTPIAMIKKTGPGLVIAQVVDRGSGAPVSGAAIRLLQNRADAGEAKTDATGIARFDLKSGSEDNLMLIARNGADSAMASVESWALRQNQEAVALSYIYTDRPIYRPGHKVGFRAILRGENANGWRRPEVSEFDCDITDPEGKPVDRRKVSLSEFGTVSGEWQIPQNAALGYYSIQLRAGESTNSGSFQVEEYRKPEYEVKVTPSKPRVLQGERIEFTIDSRYYFGEPVTGAQVRYTIRRSRHWNWFFGDYDPEDFADEGGDPGFYGEVVHQGESKLDTQGITKISVATRSHEFDEDYRIEARVMDAARREVTGRGVAFASVGNFVLQAEPEKYVYAPGETAKIRVRAFDYEGKPLAEIPVSLGRTSARTNVDGVAEVTLLLSEPGSRKVEITSGRVKTMAYLWVSGNISAPPGEGRITLVPDKKSYKPGETAKVLVVTGVRDASVLVGVEGRALYVGDVRKSAEPSFIFEVPVRPEYAPNAFVTAAFLKDGKYYFGSKSLKVPASDKLLGVSAVPSKPQFKPGEPASYMIRTTGQDGQPVSAEVSLGVVDEAIYGVEPDTTPRIEQAFYGRTYDRVYTDSSLSYYFWGQAGKRAMPIARLRQHTLAQVKPPRPNDPRVRKAFPDTALWLPAIKTDGSGRAEVKLQFPDSITAWRATARAVTADTKVGGATNRVTTRKDLILRLAAPRFLTHGDEAIISAIVNNYLTDTKKSKVTLEATGLEILDGGTRDGEAAAKVETTFDFRVRVKGGEQATLTAKAITDEESDALEIDLPLKPFGVKITEARSGVLTDTGKASAKITFPEGGEARAMDIRAMPSLAGAIFGALDYLTSFPYGCTEQTLSSFVPNATVDRALRELKLSGIDRVRLNKQIQEGLERLADFQHPDGGWGFWQSDDSGAFMTANVVAALDQAGTWGRINRDRARAWLRQAFAREKRADPDFRAFLAYALNEPAAIEEIWNIRDSLSPYGLALLGLRLDGQRAQEIAGRLEKRMEPEGYWKSSRDTLMDFEVDNSAEVTAIAVKFLAKLSAQSPLLPKAVQWPVDHRNDGYYWSSTKQTANVVYALTDYLKLSGELDPKLSAAIKINGESVWNKELTQADAISVRPAGLRILPTTASNDVEIESDGKGRLYWSLTSSHYEERPRIDRSRGLSIQREYLREVSPGTTAAFDGVAKPGETIISRVTVRGGQWRYLVIEDPIAAGVELMKDSRWYGTHRELRDDRAAYFETFFDGSRRYEVRMKVTRPGKFRISPARVAPMYQPGIIAVSDAASMEVRP